MRKRVLAMFLGLALPSVALAQEEPRNFPENGRAWQRGGPRFEGGRPNFPQRIQPLAPQPPMAFQPAPRAPEPAERPAFRPNPADGGPCWRDRGLGGPSGGTT
ncbi:MAG: hypothetical protein K2X76_04485, partial [Sphingomonas sp.]|nr:hypothetical protein [Sphingomonas sp.]